MTVKELKKYLFDICILEEQCYTLNNTINEINRRIKWLCTIGDSEKPKKPTYDKFEPLWEIGKWFLMSLGTFAMLAFLAIPALFIIDIFGMGKKADNITFLIWAGIPIILFVVFTIFNISDIPSLKRDYKKSVADYEATWKKLQDRVDKERIEKKLLIEEKDSLYEIYQKQKKLLSDMYNLAIIHPKYRNWVAIASFYDYFDCGICSTMAGHEGAYNKYDEDLKFGILVGKLNEVIDMLGDIRSKQETICHMIEDGNRKSQKLLADSVRYSQQACEISSSAQYYNQINADNTRMLLFLEAYNTFKQ